MRLRTILGLALLSLKRAPVRSALTALGVIVGVAAVVATASIGSGAEARLRDALTRPEARVVYLFAAVRHSGHTDSPPPVRTADALQLGDYYAIQRSIADITATTPKMYLPALHVQANGRSVDAVVEGLDVGGFSAFPRRLLAGALFSESDVRRVANVCLISRSLAQRLFADDLRLGRLLRVNNTSLQIIGVLDDARMAVETARPVPDMHLYIPFTTMLHRLDRTASTSMSISVQARDAEHVRGIERRISDVMEERRSGRKSEFRTNTSFDSLKSYGDGTRTVTRLLTLVGAVTLVVGGIGIMNIMLVSVTERTREVGIRMALGTRHRAILGQFLLEAMTLSLLGGASGVTVGWGASLLITRWNDWPTLVTPISIATALICSVTVGMLFGYHPARQAAQLQPVESLRVEY